MKSVCIWHNRGLLARVFPLPQGQIAVTLRDAQACFNLNALAQPTTASRPLAVQQLIALIRA
ncbi:hypothetical protein DMH88_15250 [Escherichia coli]|nr:hypothetical protein [Escherichia coli]